MRTKQRVNGPKLRGQTVKAQSAAGLAEVARATSRLCTLRWQGYFLGDTRGLPAPVLETIARAMTSSGNGS